MKQKKQARSVIKIMIFFIFIAVIIELLRNYFLLQKVSPQKKNINITPIPSQTINKPIQADLFIPYWQISHDANTLTLPEADFDQQLNSYIYFALNPTLTGINQQDQEYKKMSQFLDLTQNFKGNKYLVLKMISSSNNTIKPILADQSKQNKVLNQAVKIADQNQFDGLLIDLEMSSLATQNITHQINIFTELASKKVKSSGLKFGLIIYADIYYRGRPYDLANLEPHCDIIYFMAYDLHKPYGTPGPNFPLYGKEKYDYDLSTAIDQIITRVKPEKINIVFGLFGYDWLVDIKKRPFRNAEVLTTAQINNQFVINCLWQNCVSNYDHLAKETEINYVDNNGELHIVWFDNQKSITDKVNYLKLQGINNISYWALGYY